jgi:hypothetical protein
LCCGASPFVLADSNVVAQRHCHRHHGHHAEGAPLVGVSVRESGWHAPRQGQRARGPDCTSTTQRHYPPRTALHFSTLHCTALHYHTYITLTLRSTTTPPTLHYTTLHCTALHYIALHWTTPPLHFMTFATLAMVHFTARVHSAHLLLAVHLSVQKGSRAVDQIRAVAPRSEGLSGGE